MREHTLTCGREQQLVATLTWPVREDQRPATVVVLTNSGVIPRSGPQRINVQLARRLATLGLASIRFDMSGLGDSRRASGQKPMLEQWTADTRDVMDVAQTRFGCDRFVMVGFCSGAEVAHLAALEDPRLHGAVLWDLYAYPTPESRLRALLYRLQRAGVSGLVRKLSRIVRSAEAPPASARAATPAGQSADAGKVPPAAEYARRLRTLSERGVRLLVMYSGGEPQWYNHADQFRKMFGPHTVPPAVQCDWLQMSDHLLTRRASREAFISRVTAFIEQGGFRHP